MKENTNITYLLPKIKKNLEINEVENEDFAKLLEILEIWQTDFSLSIGKSCGFINKKIQQKKAKMGLMASLMLLLEKKYGKEKGQITLEEALKSLAKHKYDIAMKSKNKQVNFASVNAYISIIWELFERNQFLNEKIDELENELDRKKSIRKKKEYELEAD